MRDRRRDTAAAHGSGILPSRRPDVARAPTAMLLHALRSPRPRRRLARLAWLLLAAGLSGAGAAPVPAPRCPDRGAAPAPAYGPVDGPPAVAAWTDLDALPEGCRTTLDAAAPLAVALAGRFTHAGSVEDLAARLGAVSSTVGLPYWSVSDGAWKPLVSEAFALAGPDPDERRADFDAREVLGGETLHFAQNDTRSWGTNVYRLRTLEASPDRIVVASDNVSGIGLGPVTLFAPHALASVQFVERLEGATWGYYGLAVVRGGAFAAREKSLVNRQAALYRLLIGAVPDGAPPLAP